MSSAEAITAVASSARTTIAVASSAATPNPRVSAPIRSSMVPDGLKCTGDGCLRSIFLFHRRQSFFLLLAPNVSAQVRCRKAFKQDWHDLPRAPLSPPSPCAFQAVGFRCIPRRRRQLVGWAEKETGVTWPEALGRHGDWTRDAVVYVSVRHGGWRLSEVVGRIAGLKYPAPAQGVKRIEARRTRDKACEWFTPSAPEPNVNYLDVTPLPPPRSINASATAQSPCRPAATSLYRPGRSSSEGCAALI